MGIPAHEPTVEEISEKFKAWLVSRKKFFEKREHQIAPPPCIEERLGWLEDEADALMGAMQDLLVALSSANAQGQPPATGSEAANLNQPK